MLIIPLFLSNHLCCIAINNISAESRVCTHMHKLSLRSLVCSFRGISITNKNTETHFCFIWLCIEKHLPCNPLKISELELAHTTRKSLLNQNIPGPMAVNSIWKSKTNSLGKHAMTPYTSPTTWNRQAGVVELYK